MNYEECVRKGKTYIIAEMSGNHAGSFQKAMDIVHAAADAGADCLKTQTYTADTLTLDCDRDEFLVKGGLWDGRRLYDLYKVGFTPWEWEEEIKSECEKCGMDFMSTPFDKTAVDFLEKIGCKYYKIASPELIDLPLIDYTARLGKPMFVSTGMANEMEMEEAVDVLHKRNVPFVLLKCCSQYPSDFANMNLNTIKLFKYKFDCPVGLSDHSEGSLGAVVAVSLGARVVEKHICLSNDDADAVDAKFSMNPSAFTQLVKDIRDAEKIMGIAQFMPSKGELRALKNRRSLYVSRNIKCGELFTEENIKSVRPAKGLKPKYFDYILNKKAACDISFGTPLSWDFVEGGEPEIN